TSQSKYFEACRTDLNPLEKINDYPLFPVNELCSLRSCFRNISYDPINQVIYKRLAELAERNFYDGIYLFLIEGENSVEKADALNQSISDDQNLIYISVDDFINSPMISKGIKLYNGRMKKLMSGK